MKRIFSVLRGFTKQLSEDNIVSYASSCAFFIFLSLVPTMILFLTILPYTPIDFNIILPLLDRELPEGAAAFARSIILEVSERSVGKMSLAAIATLWSAGKGVNSLVTGFNAIDKQKDGRNVIVLRLISCLYTLIFLASILAVLLLMVYGNVGAEVLTEHFPELKNFFNIFVNLKTIISISLLVVIFMICYAVLPYKRHKFRAQLPGAIFAALGWVGFSYIFSLYVRNYNAFSMYGSLTAIIILLMWLYVCMYILLIGANMNRYFRPIFRVLDIKNLNQIRNQNQKESLEED